MNINVSVRLRPLNANEKESGSDCAVSMDGHTTTIHSFHGAQKSERSFEFDRSYWSCNKNDEHYASQETLMHDIGEPLSRNVIGGYNGCLFAYGQTGAGKSHSIMGTPTDAGLLLRIIGDIYEKRLEPDEFMHVRISIIECYGEQVRDLLAPVYDVCGLKVIDHPVLGVTIPYATESSCETLADAQRLVFYALKKRVVGNTVMNSTSSRSHLICTIHVAAGNKDEESIKGDPTRRRNRADGRLSRQSSKNESTPRSTVAKIQILDLSGSEKVSRNAVASRTKKRYSINHCLLALGTIVQQLSEGKCDKLKIAFRSSKLTLLMREALAGNSRTYMVAAIGPGRESVDETLSTLRFAASVKQIKTTTRVNVDKSDELLVLLNRDIKRLRGQLAEHGDGSDIPPEVETLLSELQNELSHREQLQTTMMKTHAERMMEETRISALREAMLEEIGLSSESMETLCIANVPFLVNLSNDPQLTGCLLFQLQYGDTSIGKDMSNSITLKGLGIRDTMCTLKNNDNRKIILSLSVEPDLDEEDEVEDNPSAAYRIYVNGERVTRQCEIMHMDTICFGRACVLRLIVPAKQSMLSHDEIHSEQMLSEISVGDSAQFRDLRLYLFDLRNRLEESLAEEVIKKLGELSKLIDEANEITAEVRPLDGFRLQLELVWDIDIEYKDIEDMIVIRVLQYEGHISADSLYYWTVPKFRERLESMREKYDEFYQKSSKAIEKSLGTGLTRFEGDGWFDKIKFEGAYDTVRDPWLEASMSDMVQSMYMSGYNATLRESAKNLVRTAAEGKIARTSPSFRKSATARFNHRPSDGAISHRAAHLNGSRPQTSRDADVASDDALKQIIATQKARLEDMTEKLRLQDEKLAQYDGRRQVAEGLKSKRVSVIDSKPDDEISPASNCKLHAGPPLHRTGNTINLREMPKHPHHEWHHSSAVSLHGVMTPSPSVLSTAAHFSFNNRNTPAATLTPFGDKRKQSPFQRTHVVPPQQAPEQPQKNLAAAHSSSRGKLGLSQTMTERPLLAPFAWGSPTAPPRERDRPSVLAPPTIQPPTITRCMPTYQQSMPWNTHTPSDVNSAEATISGRLSGGSPAVPGMRQYFPSSAPIKSLR